MTGVVVGMARPEPGPPLVALAHLAHRSRYFGVSCLRANAIIPV